MGQPQQLGQRYPIGQKQPLGTQVDQKATIEINQVNSQNTQVRDQSSQASQMGQFKQMTNQTLPITQLNDGDLLPKPNVGNLPPKEAKKVLKEWQKRVDAQAKHNRQLAKQQQDAAKKVERLKAKGKPVPEKLEYLASGALIEESNRQARNNVINVRGQESQLGSQRNQDNLSTQEYDEESTVTVKEWTIHTLKTLIPIYGIIYMVKAALGKLDTKPSLREFCKFQSIILIIVTVLFIASTLIMQIIMSNMW